MNIVKAQLTSVMNLLYAMVAVGLYRLSRYYSVGRLSADTAGCNTTVLRNNNLRRDGV